MDQGIISIYYSVADEKEAEKLLALLRMVHPTNLLRLYPDNQEGWETSADVTNNSLHIILMLITASFLNARLTKDYIPSLVKHWQEKNMDIFPIIAKGCAWETVSWLHHLIVWPHDGQPLWLNSSSHHDENLTRIVYEVARAKRASITKTVRVVVADDHVHAVEGLRSIVEKTAEMKVVGLADSKLKVLEQVRTTLPDILILDVAWPGDKEFGLKLIPQIKRYSSSTKIIAITNYPELVAEAQQAGVFPLLKGFSKDLLLDTIRWALNDNSRPSSPELTPINKPPLNAMPEKLTKREQQVLGLIVKGQTDKEIALNLGIAEGTVKKHVSNILSKLGVSSRTEAAVMAERFNLLA